MRLGTLLLRDAVVSLDQLEAALHGQVVHGGRLGTHLVALGFLDLDVLSRYLGEALDMPVATREMFESADPDVLAALDPGLAERCQAFPLGHVDGRPGTLAVAFANPRDVQLVKLLARTLDQPIAPHVAPELRIHEYLERHYGVRRKPHRPAEPRSSGAMPEDIRGPGERERPALSPMGYEEATGALARAGSRDQVGDALIGFAAGRFGAAAVLAIRKGEAVPWRMHTASGHVAAGPAAGLSLSRPSVLQAAHDKGEPYRGRAPCMQQIERDLWRALDVDREPREMLVVPVLVKQHVVNLIYAHGMGGDALDETAAGQLVALAGRAAHAYGQIIQRNRRG